MVLDGQDLDLVSTGRMAMRLIGVQSAYKVFICVIKTVFLNIGVYYCLYVQVYEN